MVFNHLDGMFGGVDSMFIWRDKLPFDFVFTQVFGESRRGFIVEDVESWFETLTLQIRKNVVKSGNDGGRFAIGDGSNDDGIGCVVIGDKNVLLIFQ